MRLNLILLSMALLLCLSTASIFGKYVQFKRYTQEYNKKYTSTIIQLYRFNNYLNNLLDIQYLNKVQQGTAVYGETRFTDLSKQEMKQFLGVRIPHNYKLKYIKNYTNDEVYVPKQDTPDIWNWVQQGAVTGIKDQGSCGSCWTFSTVGNIQSLYYLKNKKLVDLSQQQLIDCDKSNFGCAGGWPYNAIDWLSKHGGLQTASDYPLRSNYSGPCQYNQSKSFAKIKGYMNITHDEKIIKDALYEIGPLSILLDFTGLMHYKSGVANPLLCSTWPDHALVLVGYGVKDEDYWLIKNSWGPKWGINGYLMLKRGANKCAINLFTTTAILQDQ